MGGFVACYNYLTFRLEAAPLGLSTTVTSLLFLAYLAGTVSSPLAGRLSDRFGRRRLALSGIVVSLAGLALMLPDHIASITVGLLVFTAGFFATHSVASSWVSSLAAGRRGQAAAMYLLAYYLGSSAFGALIGLAYQYDGWPAAAASIGTAVRARRPDGARDQARAPRLTGAPTAVRPGDTASAQTTAPGSASRPGRVPNIRNAHSAVVGGVRNSSVLTRVAPLRRSTSR